LDQSISRIFLSGIIIGLFLVLILQGSALGYTGKEIIIKLGNAQSVPVNGTTYYKINVNISYTVSDSSLIGKKINAVMKVHALNGTVIKTTSFPSGFIANRADMARMVTNIPISNARNITTETVFTDLNKTNILSNVVKTLPMLFGTTKSSQPGPTVIGNKTE
jgi:hypothetical protein